MRGEGAEKWTGADGGEGGALKEMSREGELKERKR